jgi:outer membrane protein assembly factor BamB
MTDLGQSVTQRGGDSARTAHWIEPNLTQTNVAKMAPDANFKATFSGEMTGVPLFLASTTPGKGMFLVATTQNDVFALDETTGVELWTHNIGAGKGGGPGPGIAHGGIVSTPVVDGTARVIYVAAAMAANRHEIHALSADSGMELPGWPVDVSKVTAGATTFDFSVQNQRSALSLVNGVVYVAFGGYYGDGGTYHGWVVSVNATDPTKVAGWATQGIAEGIWAPGGMASDGNGVFAITGNSHSANGNHNGSDGEEVVRITGMSQLTRSDANIFYPDIWSSGMDHGDLDFGACSPAVVSIPGSTPSTLVVAPAKPGRVYFLDPANLGGMAGQLADIVVASTTQESVYTSPTAYQTSTGLDIAISTALGSACPGGMSNSNVMGLSMKAGSPPMPTIKWCAKISDDDEVRRRSPISTNSNTSGADPIVWFMNGSALNAFNGDTGAAITFNGGNCGGVHRHTAPIAANNRIIVGGDGHLCSWSVQP